MNFENTKNESENLKEPKKKYHFFYKDSFDNRKLVFECDADDILEADAEMERQTGINPSKKNNIGISFERN